PAISIDLKERIIGWYTGEDKYTMEEIVDLADVSIGLVSNTVNLYRQYGQVTNPFSHCTGCPRIMNEGDFHYIEEILRVNPTLYIDEIQSKLESVREV
ncbi:hypothetical protein DFH09DRAFT_845754, partial [Mycena vulgaris]